MEDKLRTLGLRLEGNYTLHSGAKSLVFWDVERLFRYPYWVRVGAIKPFIWEIGIRKPELLVGVGEGGYKLAKDIARCLDLKVMDDTYHCNKKTTTFECLDTILIDDVMTTGGSIRRYLEESNSVIAVAILVNRSGLDEISGIPIITGIHADKVEI